MATVRIATPCFPPIPKDAVGLCCPPGIGDISWLVSKMWSLSSRSGRQVYLSTPGGIPQRSHQLVQLLPERYGIHWAGYTQTETMDVIDLARDTRLDELREGEWHCVEVNTWLEAGKPLSTWEPWLPTDYHYALDIPTEQVVRASELTDHLQGVDFGGIYVSNRDKARWPAWALWSTKEWCRVLLGIHEQHGIGYVLIGAEYDRDRIHDVAAVLGENRVPYVRCVGESLGTALECLRRASMGLWYPSGIGILGDVLNVQGVMLLPKPLQGMERAFADPKNLDSGRYRAWTTPTPEGVLKWAEGLSL